MGDRITGTENSATFVGLAMSDRAGRSLTRFSNPVSPSTPSRQSWNRRSAQIASLIDNRAPRSDGQAADGEGVVGVGGPTGKSPGAM